MTTTEGAGARVGTSEPQLVDRARTGDSLAFEALMRERIDPLFRTAWAILGSEADARDATQEACLSAWRELPRLRDTRAFDAWLHRVLVNACRMAIRRRSRVREVAIERIEEVDGSTAIGPEAFEETEAIARAFERLNPDQRTILVLHHLRHETVASIASALSVPPGTVKSRLHSARAALESNLARERR